MGAPIAVEAVRVYAERNGLRWVRAGAVRRHGWLWGLIPRFYAINATAEDGRLEASVLARPQVVVFFELVPSRPGGPLLPPRVVRPGLSGVSVYWRMGGGEAYREERHQWFAALPPDAQAAYARGHPEPDASRGSFYCTALTGPPSDRRWLRRGPPP